MTPRLSLCNQPDVGVIDAEGVCQRLAAFSVFEAAANFAHLVSGKFSRANGFAVQIGIYATTLGVHIRDVVGGGSDKQVSRIHAERDIALVANMQPRRDASIVQFVRESVSQGAASGAREVEYSIPVALLWSSPEPAIVWPTFVNIFPKTLNRWARRAISVGVPLQIMVRLACNNAACPIRSPGNAGFSSTSAMAVAVGDFLRRIVRGMLAHVDKLLSAIGHATGRLQRRGGAFIGCYRSIVAQVGRCRNHAADLLEPDD